MRWVLLRLLGMSMGWWVMRVISPVTEVMGTPVWRGRRDVGLLRCNTVTCLPCLWGCGRVRVHRRRIRILMWRYMILRVWMARSKGVMRRCGDRHWVTVDRLSRSDCSWLNYGGNGNWLDVRRLCWRMLHRSEDWRVHGRMRAGRKYRTMKDRSCRECGRLRLCCCRRGWGRRWCGWYSRGRL